MRSAVLHSGYKTDFPEVSPSTDGLPTGCNFLGLFTPLLLQNLLKVVARRHCQASGDESAKYLIVVRGLLRIMAKLLLPTADSRQSLRVIGRHD
jgi:hypothetical protein